MMNTTSYGSRDSAMRVEPRRSTNIATTPRSRAPAADRGVRQTRVAHRLEDRAPDRRSDHAARGMAQLVGAAEAGAQPARKQRRPEQRPEGQLEALAPHQHARALRRLHAGEVDVVPLDA